MSVLKGHLAPDLDLALDRDMDPDLGFTLSLHLVVIMSGFCP